MSDHLSVAVADDLSGRLDAAPAAIAATLGTVAEVLQRALLARVETKVRGGVVEVRTGTLLRSLSGTVAAGADGFVARVASDARQAKILEYGADLPARDILPNAAQALKFGGGAGAVYAAAVHVPAARLDPHSFLRASLDEMEGDITGALKGGVHGALAETLR